MAETLTGLGGGVNVIESDFGANVDYSVDILDGSSVAAFAVSNGGGESPFASTIRVGWSAVVLNSTNWDTGTLITGSSSGVSFNTQSIGSYSSIFGTDPLVSLYYFNSSDTGAAIDESSDEMFQFTFSGDADSDFVALSSSGAIIDGSAVPEPSAFLFFDLAAIMALGIDRVRARR